MTATNLSLRYAALSDVGRVRKDNQDSGFASEHLLVVADGVGGAARGDIASSTAVQILRRLDSPAPDDLLEAVAGAIHRAHDRIAELVDEDPELDGTSTTVTAALFDGSRIGVGHIGDSRGYLVRDGGISQLTKDHTFVQSLIDEGRITEEESRVHPHRNLILRAVDGVHETDPDLFLVDLAPGDRIMLCSDGCSGVLDNDRLVDILTTGSVDYAAVELVRAALEAGSTDNVTCVVADVVAADAPPADGERAAATATGPMLVGAAADQPRKATAGAKSRFRGHRSGDTGEMDPVPGDEDDVDPEALRYAPRPPRRFIWLRRIAALLVVAFLVLLLGRAAWSWSQDQYYVAADGDAVAIYQGVEADIPGMELTSVFEETDIDLDTLPDYRAKTVRGGISADSLEAARAIVGRLDELVRECAPPPSPSPSPSATTSPSPTGSGTPDGQRSDRPRGPQQDPTGRPGASASPAAASPSDGPRAPGTGSPSGSATNPSPSPSSPSSPSSSSTVLPDQCEEAP